MAIITCVTNAYLSNGMTPYFFGFKMILLKPTANLDKTANKYQDHLSDELSGDGYTAGGIALPNPTVTTSGATAILTFSKNPFWDGINQDVGGAAIIGQNDVDNVAYFLFIMNFMDDAHPNGINPQGNVLELDFPAADATNGFLRLL